MATTASEIELMIQHAFPDAPFSVDTITGTEDGYFSAHVISRQFEGKTRLERHRMVFDALKDLKGAPPSLAVQTDTP